MSYIGLQEKYNRIRSLMQMAKSDGNVNLAELTFIVWVSQKLGISKVELDELATEKDNFSAPFSEEERIDMLYDLIKVMYVDGIVSPEELSMCEDLANQMHLDASKIANLMSSIKDNSNKLMSKDDFISIFS